MEVTDGVESQGQATRLRSGNALAQRPNAIDNRDLADADPQSANGEIEDQNNLPLRKDLAENCDYVLVPQNVWRLFVSWYYELSLPSSLPSFLVRVLVVCWLIDDDDEKVRRRTFVQERGYTRRDLQPVPQGRTASDSSSGLSPRRWLQDVSPFLLSTLLLLVFIVVVVVVVVIVVCCSSWSTMRTCCRSFRSSSCYQLSCSKSKTYHEASFSRTATVKQIARWIGGALNIAPHHCEFSMVNPIRSLVKND